MVNKYNFILLTSVGGPAAENVIKCFNLARKVDKTIPKIIGVDCDPIMIKLSSADETKIIPSLIKNKNMYLLTIDQIIRKRKVDMLYPQSDVECKCAAWNFFEETTLPAYRTMSLCSDKGMLYGFLFVNNIPTPKFLVGEPTKWNRWKLGNYPYWLRARQGAGGAYAYKINNFHQLKGILSYYREEKINWMISQFLSGRNYSWTSIWKNGELITSVTKERLKWVYNRIGTTSIQKIVHNQKVNNMCVKAIKTLQKDISGIMMVDLKEDENGTPFITEINAGRIGTTGNQFPEMAMYVCEDPITCNFPYLLWLIHTNQKLPKLAKFDPLPKNLYYVRHIDMKPKIFMGE